MQTIKCCPFCGAHEVHICETAVYWIRCVECDSEGETGNTKNKAIKNWNRRHYDDEPAKVI